MELKKHCEKHDHYENNCNDCRFAYAKYKEAEEINKKPVQEQQTYEKNEDWRKKWTLEFIGRICPNLFTNLTDIDQILAMVKKVHLKLWGKEW